MPIVFAPPGPLRGDISAGYGAAEQWSRDFPALARQQSDIAHAYLQSAALQARAAGQQAQLQQNAQLAALQSEGRQAEDFQHYQLAQQQMAHQTDMQAQHYQLMDQLNQNQLTRGEQMRLQRLQEARAAVMGSPTLTDVEKQDALLQIQSGISPLQQRQQRSQLQMQQLQQQMAERQIAEFDRLQNERDKFNKSTLQDRIRVDTDEFGQDHKVVLGRDGSVDYHATQLYQQQTQNTLGALQGGQVGGGTRQRNAGQGGQQGPDQAFDLKALDAAGRLARLMTGKDDNGRDKPVDEALVTRLHQAILSRARESAAPNQPTPPTRQQVQADVWQEIQEAFPELTPDQMRRMRDAEVNRRMGVQQTEMQRRRQAALDVERSMERLGPLIAGGITPEHRQRLTEQRLEQLRPAGTRTAAGFEVLGRPLSREQARPWPRTEGGEIDRERLTAGQQAVVNIFDDFRQRAGALPEDRASHFRSVVGRAERLVAQHGSPEHMPPDVRRQYDGFLELLGRIPRPEPRRSDRQDHFPGVGARGLTEEERLRAESVAGM